MKYEILLLVGLPTSMSNLEASCQLKQLASYKITLYGVGATILAFLSFFFNASSTLEIANDANSRM